MKVRFDEGISWNALGLIVGMTLGCLLIDAYYVNFQINDVYFHVRSLGWVFASFLIIAFNTVAALRIRRKYFALTFGSAAGAGIAQVISNWIWVGAPDYWVHGDRIFNVCDVIIVGVIVGYVICAFGAYREIRLHRSASHHVESDAT